MFKKGNKIEKLKKGIVFLGFKISGKKFANYRTSPNFMYVHYHSTFLKLLG